jgi:beta-alanine--pyruvate transaminase
MGIELESLWMPFTHNRMFKKDPRLVERALGMYYQTSDGHRVLDAISGLWCSNAGHRHPKIVQAVKDQLDELDFAAPFQSGHPKAFALAEAIRRVSPIGLNHVFLTSSGSEACDTALKIALAYHQVIGGSRKTRFVGREKGYHGVGFGGISVGGISSNQEAFKASLLPGTMHLPHTHNLSKMAFSKGQPLWGAHLADDLERLIKENGAETIAAVIVEPMQGSAGVIVPPQGYLERLRSICDLYHVLLIFDEVITGFGRLGEWFSPNRLGVIPDMITFAKGVTSGVVPLGGVLVRDEIYYELMTGPDHLVEFFHGYTYSGHPLACAAGLAAINVYEEEGLLVQARKLEIELENAVHSLRNEAHIIDIRNIGMAAAIEFEMRDDQPSLRAMEIFKYCFDHGVMVRYTGDIIAIGPALVCDSGEIEVIVETVRAAIRAVH